MKKLTNMFHVEQSKKFKVKHYGEPTGQDIASAIVGAVLLILLIATLAHWG